MNQDIENTIINVIAKQKKLDPSAINLSSSLEELGVSSLEAITIVYDMEEAFDVEVPDESLAGLKTVQDIVDGINLIVEKG